jgi:enoyl-CoA hydratase/carnithine racemase
MDAAVLVERRQRALWITINRPQAHNALNRAVSEGLAGAVEGAAGEAGIRAVVLTGAGERSFCAGADLKEGQSAEGRSTFSSGGGDNPLVRVLRAMRSCPVPVIGRINGAALGGGLGLVSGCDLVYAAEHARFGTPEVKVGVFPMMITAHLIRQLPRRRYWEMAYLGEPLSAQEAQAFHLINRAVPGHELDALIESVLERLCANSPNALRAGKLALEVMQDLNVEQSLAYAQLVIEKLAQSEEAREGMQAFAQKRPPAWAVPPKDAA